MNNYLGLIFILLVLGCANNSDNAILEMADSEIFATEEETETSERKLIKEGQVEFESQDLNSTRQTIFKAVEKHKGYISSDQEFKTPEHRSNTVVIRVPFDEFDAFLTDATQGVEKFDSKNINVKDVTEEFLDIEARLKTKKELETRFLDLLKQAKTVSEILEIEVELGELRADIESTEGRLNYLKNQVSFSTLRMTFYEVVPNQTEFGRQFKNGFRNGWDNLILFFVLLTNIWPFILLGLGLVLGFKFYKMKK
ncbi:DUF4349 domain-containing protein [Algoriphagus aquimarinus]|uniref:DUF4349 domain-containing protein n=1 Tax=Algoriphagus aquimarinus TaxID=237018 RepID=UPI0030D8D71D